MELSPSEARIELSILDSKAQDVDRLDAFVHFLNQGLPQEVVLRLQDLWDKREEIAGRVVHVGRIALTEINRFIEDNPHLAIGAALGAAVAALVSFIPVLGPLALALGITVGGLLGHRLDDGEARGPGWIGLAQELIVLARKFFELLISVFKALRPQPAAT